MNGLEILDTLPDIVMVKYWLTCVANYDAAGNADVVDRERSRYRLSRDSLNPRSADGTDVVGPSSAILFVGPVQYKYWAKPSQTSRDKEQQR